MYSSWRDRMPDARFQRHHADRNAPAAARVRPTARCATAAARPSRNTVHSVKHDVTASTRRVMRQAAAKRSRLEFAAATRRQHRHAARVCPPAATWEARMLPAVLADRHGEAPPPRTAEGAAEGAAEGVSTFEVTTGCCDGGSGGAPRTSGVLCARGPRRAPSCRRARASPVSGPVEDACDGGRSSPLPPPVTASPPSMLPSSTLPPYPSPLPPSRLLLPSTLPTSLPCRRPPRRAYACIAGAAEGPPPGVSPSVSRPDARLTRSSTRAGDGVTARSAACTTHVSSVARRIGSRACAAANRSRRDSISRRSRVSACTRRHVCHKRCFR